MSARSRTLAVGALLLMASGPCASAASAPTDVSDGLRLALLICANCHVVAPDQKFHPILKRPAPSFVAIANRKATSAESLRAFLGTMHATTIPPFAMPDPELADYQTNAIVAYMLSLRRAH